MNKIMVQVIAESDVAIARDRTLGELSAIITSYIEKYGEDAEYVIEYHNEWVDEHICIERMETDAEYEKRMMVATIAENKERALYEKLKAKYG